MALTPGTILGQYEIRSPLGAGGMGEVYRAHDARLDREVAIKVLPESLTSDPDRLRRFEQEARAAAALNHPNILAVYQMATHEGVSYMVTELLEGETLRERLRREPIPLRKAMDYSVQIARGLAAAHDKGIVHRDLKPENLFVTKDGRVKILDFGLAKLTPLKESSGAEVTIDLGTEPGMVMGTAGFMSPEQVRGKTADHRSDIFAFGAILYEMVTGKQTFRKLTSADTMAAILNEEPPSISQIAPTAPPGLQRVVHRCLEKDPEQRFHSAHDLAFALEALSDSAITTPSGSHVAASGSWSRRRIAVVAVAAVMALGAALFAYLWIRPEPVPRVSNYVQLTHGEGRKYIIGTEGSRLYLWLDGHDYQGIGEISTSGGEPRKLSVLPSPKMYASSLSRDGMNFLVLSGQGLTGSIWSVPVLGGSPRRLGDAVGSEAVLSSDGKFLAYCNGNEIFVAKADGSEPRKLITMKDHPVIRDLAWSPDGSHLRFGASEGSLSRPYLWEISADGTGLHRLLPSWTQPQFSEYGCQWTPNGQYYLFQSRQQIWALPRKGFLFPREPKPIQLTSSPLSMLGAMPSSDGKKLFVVAKLLRGELVRYDFKAGTFVPLLGGISAEYLDFSKDGQWVVYVSYPEGTLWRSKTDGSERLQLTDNALRAFSPRWSPDGKKIVFSSVNPPKMFEVSAEGGTPRQLMPSDPNPQTDPSWSLDGGKIVFSGNGLDPSSLVRVFDFTTHAITTLPGSQGLFSSRWSPDGRYVAALSADLTRLLLFEIQTQRWTELVKGELGWPTWSKDGKYLYFTEGFGSSWMRLRMSDHKVERTVDLKDFGTTGALGNWFALAPDGSPMSLRDAGSQDVYALDWEEP
jgi:serine/threonine protein kinase/Tol biopolymer transport system component